MAFVYNYNESEEDYLEQILILSNHLSVVRSVDIANAMGFKKSSISVAMKKLREKDYITVSEGGYISLTPEGRKIAEQTYERHRLITKWLVFLGVPSDIAEQDACRMEHVISQESFEALKQHIHKEHNL